MNRSLIVLSLTLGLLFSPVSFASDDTTSGAKVGVKTSFQDKLNSQKELNAAIRNRQVRYLLELRRGHEDRYSQQAQHKYSLYRNNVDTTATFLSREGELTDYEGRRAFSNPSLAAPNTSKRNFRVRAVDYYLEEGDAGAEALEENVILGSQHKVKREYYNKQLGGQSSYADLVNGIRQMQRSNYAPSNPDSQFTPFSQRNASNGRNYLHPFMGGLE